MSRSFAFLLLIILILAPHVTKASTDLSTEKSRPFQLNLDIGQGFESNVFLSDNKPQSDSFTLLEANGNALLKPNSQSLLFIYLSGSHQQFSSLNQADRTFTNTALDYRYFISSFFGFGLSNTLSYADLKLIDTEGNALPREKFQSLTEQVRIYGLFFPSKVVELELGGAFRIMDLEEEVGQESLDFQEFGMDLSSKIYLAPKLNARLKYKYAVISYDERQASNRLTSFNGFINPNNPAVRINRHEISSRLQYGKNTHYNIEVRGRLRINDDRFEDHFSYREGEVRGRIEAKKFLKIATLDAKLSYKDRYYTDRRNELGSGAALKEGFLIYDLNLHGNLWDWFQAYMNYQWIHAVSNKSIREFNDHIGLLGVKMRW